MSLPLTVPLSVAIPAFQNEPVLKESLQRICKCRPLPAEILIHLDGGWSPELIGVDRLPVPVRLVHSNKNIGPGGGRDRLFKEANHEIIASFDDDSWPLDEEYFLQAVAMMEARPDAAILSPAVYLKEKPIMPQMPEVSTARGFEGSASIHRRSHHLRLPGYVPVPAAYGVEEADISLQAHAAGYVILSCPWMRAWHERPYADNVHSVLPWIQNEILLTYLRYPLVAQPWGWVRALRHVWRHRKVVALPVLLKTLFESPLLCVRYRAYRRRYSLREVWLHLRMRSQLFKIEKVSES